MIIWLTGQPGAGKSTISRALNAALLARGYRVALIDGEDLRRETGNQDYSTPGRIANVKAGQLRASELVAAGFIVVASFVSPNRAVRDEFKLHQRVLEVFLHTTRTSPKDAFQAVDYEPPLSNYVDVDTSALNVDQSVELILDAALRAPTLVE